MKNPTFALIALIAFIAPAAFAQDEEAPQEEASAPEASGPQVVLETSKGSIVVELDPVKAPKTVENFLAYVESGHYDGTIFHRVIQGFMIQGGGMTEDGAQKPTREPIVNEASNGLTNDRGTIAMARTNEPDSATSQFFINTVDNTSLNAGVRDPHGYAVFGKVVEGMEVADAIEKVPVRGSVPMEPVIITKASVKK